MSKILDNLHYRRRQSSSERNYAALYPSDSSTQIRGGVWHFCPAQPAQLSHGGQGVAVCIVVRTSHALRLPS